MFVSSDLLLPGYRLGLDRTSNGDVVSCMLATSSAVSSPVDWTQAVPPLCGSKHLHTAQTVHAVEVGVMSSISSINNQVSF